MVMHIYPCMIFYVVAIGFASSCYWSIMGFFCSVTCRESPLHCLVPRSWGLESYNKAPTGASMMLALASCAIATLNFGLPAMSVPNMLACHPFRHLVLPALFDVCRAFGRLPTALSLFF